MLSLIMWRISCADVVYSSIIDNTKAPGSFRDHFGVAIKRCSIDRISSYRKTINCGAIPRIGLLKAFLFRVWRVPEVLWWDGG